MRKNTVKRLWKVGTDRKVCGSVYIGVDLGAVDLHSVHSCLIVSKWCFGFSVAVLFELAPKEKKNQSHICVNQVCVQSDFLSTLEENQM